MKIAKTAEHPLVSQMSACWPPSLKKIKLTAHARCCSSRHEMSCIASGQCTIPTVQSMQEMVFNDEDFIICTDENHGVSSHDGMIFKCRFSFRSLKSASKEYRMSLLRILFDSLADRVNNAYDREN